MPKLDVKFYGDVFKAKNGERVPDDQWMCFLVKDALLVPTLVFYRDACIEAGCDALQLGALWEVIERVQEWQKANPTLVHKPDIAPGEKTCYENGTPEG